MSLGMNSSLPPAPKQYPGMPAPPRPMGMPQPPAPM